MWLVRCYPKISSGWIERNVVLLQQTAWVIAGWCVTFWLCGLIMQSKKATYNSLDRQFILCGWKWKKDVFFIMFNSLGFSGFNFHLDILVTVNMLWTHERRETVCWQRCEILLHITLSDASRLALSAQWVCAPPSLPVTKGVGDSGPRHRSQVSHINVRSIWQWFTK